MADVRALCRRPWTECLLVVIAFALIPLDARQAPAPSSDVAGQNWTHRVRIAG